jgi:uncharacterized protein
MFNRFFRRRRKSRLDNDEDRGRGMGSGTKPGSGPHGDCLCSKCGYKTQHRIGQRCMDMTCPKCGAKMDRE